MDAILFQQAQEQAQYCQVFSNARRILILWVLGTDEMTAVYAVMEKYNKIIIFSLVGVIALFLLACTFHDVLPICHWIFGCDHMMHL